MPITTPPINNSNPNSGLVIGLKEIDFSVKLFKDGSNNIVIAAAIIIDINDSKTDSPVN